MGLFSRKKYHVDEEGRVAEGAEPGMRDADELRREPKIQAKEERRQDRREWKQQQKDIYKQEFRKARLERIKQDARSAGKTTIGDRLSSFASASQPAKRSSGKMRPATSYRIKNNYNPFGSMFDTGINYKGPSRSKTSKKYAVIGGKAYPVASIGKKKKKRKRSSSSGFRGFDMTDNYGFMK